MSTELQERRQYLRRRHRRRRGLFFSALALLTAGIVAAAVWLWVSLSVRSPAEVQKKLDKEAWVDRNYLPINAYSRPGTPLKRVNAIVIHYVGNPGTTAAQNRSYYAGLAESGKTYASSNFLVGLGGEILECVPVDEVAYCSNSRNSDTVSIECCHPNESGKFNADTYDGLVRLTAWLCREFGLKASDIVRHYDITEKECPKYYVEHPDAWAAFKNDVQRTLEVSKAPSPSGQ